MKIQNITPINYLTVRENRLNKNVQNPIISQEPKEIFAYQDFNITFKARTPENFYEQEFNVKNMPETMKMYLNSDYETRKHMPPEQMMQEVFGYIKLADDFDEVKKMYPTEPLFENLHPNMKKNRNTLLAEIEMVRDLTPEPLFKDGNDDLGMYVLKKIFIEGKTIKEINKDFYEKDLNDSYKGLLKRELDYSVTDAYGIKYPKLAFWKSFIATRDEYKQFFVTLPKKEPLSKADILKKSQNTKENTQNSKETKKEVSKESQPKTVVRKYKTPTHKKTQITNEIKNSNGNLETIEKKIRKRFSNSDLEAPFVLKYMSPIMTIAANRVHLSEEMKAFTEKTNSVQSSDETFFARFWKANPVVLEDYAKTIPDTIELFEETYGAGGLIPINKDFEEIKENSADKKIIDYVPAEFLELLNYAKNIDVERQNQSELHNINQKELEEVFSQLQTIEPEKEETPNVQKEFSEEELKEMVEKSAKENNAEIYEFKDVDGNNLVFTGNLNEAFDDCIIDLLGTAPYYPKVFQDKYKKFFLSQPIVDTKFKLSVVGTKYDIQADSLYSVEELTNLTDQIDFPADFFTFPIISSFLIADYLVLKYGKKIPDEILNSVGARNFYDSIESYSIEINGESRKLSDIVKSEKENIDNLLKNYYLYPLSRKEQLTVKNSLLNQFPKFYDEAHASTDIKLFADIINDNRLENPSNKQQLGFLIEDWLKRADSPFGKYLARSIFNQDSPENILKEKQFYLLKIFLEQTLCSNKLSKLTELMSEKDIVKNFQFFSSDMQAYLACSFSLGKKLL